MTLATGLVLAITVGTLAQNSDSLMAFLGGEEIGIANEDQFTVRAGSDQILDVLGNDTIVGNITIVNQPRCGVVRASGDLALEYGESAECSGNLMFTYCVAGAEEDDECTTAQVALNVIAGLEVATSTPVQTNNAVDAVEELASLPINETVTETVPVDVVETATAPVLVQPANTGDNAIQEDVAVITNDQVIVQDLIPDGPAPVVAFLAPSGFSFNDNSGSSNLNFFNTEQSGGVVVNASVTNEQTTVDSSDIVVEMAAQILLPGARIGVTLNEDTQADAANELMMTDGLFAADLEVSSPPVAVEEQVEVASLPAEDITDAAQNPELVFQTSNQANCEIMMEASARPGAAISLLVESPCRANQIVTVAHSGFSFTTYLDESGGLAISVPAFEENAVVSVSFEDGGQAQSEVLVRDAGDMERMAIIWSVPVDLDLHAFEDQAADGSEGHVWIENARKYRDTLTGGGGFLESFGDPEIIGGTMAEVYTLPTNRLRSQTIVSMDLRINDASGYCGEKAILRTVRTQDGGTTKREFNLLMPDCSTASAGMVLENFVDAISVARR